MKNNMVKNIIILVIVLISLSLGYIIIDKLTQKEENIEYLKNYKVNEYIPTYISDEQMAEIYLNDYIHTMYYDIEYAYQLLDEEYRNKKFGSLEAYKNYVYSQKFNTYKLEKYYVKDENGYKFFGVYDQNGNVFIFKTKGVLQYTVYLDDYTVEI